MADYYDAPRATPPVQDKQSTRQSETGVDTKQNSPQSSNTVRSYEQPQKSWVNIPLLIMGAIILVLVGLGASFFLL